MTWLVETIGPAAATTVTWTVAVLVMLVLLLLVLRMLRNLLPGTYVRGGKSRHRLAVVDAAPVDANRRLILVRRDDVEHLLLIGGSGDVIVETGIGATAAQERHAVQAPAAPAAPAPAPAQSAATAVPTRQAPVQKGGDTERQAARSAGPAAPAPAAAMAPARSDTAASAAPAASLPATPPQPAVRQMPAPRRTVDTGQPQPSPVLHDIGKPAARPPNAAAQQDMPAATRPAPSAAPVEDDPVSEEALMRELQETLAPVRQSATQPQPPRQAQVRPEGERELSLEEEMSQLLQNLTRDGKS